MTASIKIVNPYLDTRWDDFVLSNPKALIYHHSSWANVLESSFGCTPFYLALQSNHENEFEGIIPFMLVKSWLTGKRLVSLPFTSYCDPLVPPSFIKKALQFSSEHHPDIHYAEFKLINNSDTQLSQICRQETSNVTHILNIDVPVNDLFQSFHNSSIRQRIKRAKRENLNFRIADTEEDLKSFYKLETLIRKKHGLPPHPYIFFLNMWRILRPKGFFFLALIEHKRRVIAAATVLKFKEIFHFEYSASNPEYQKHGANQLLIWEIIRIAQEEKANYFDFGRSAIINRSLIDFKERWGVQKYNLSSFYYPSDIGVKIKRQSFRNILERINRFLPKSILQLQSRLIYRHLS